MVYSQVTKHPLNHGTINVLRLNAHRDK